METKIVIKVRDVCGVKRGYPGNNLAQLFVDLINPRKTFNQRDVEIIKRMGIEIEAVQDSANGEGALPDHKV